MAGNLSNADSLPATVRAALLFLSSSRSLPAAAVVRSECAHR
ncbi:hypothetical protein FRUB_00493 [Fimbriiglobus ruber]|uniref:Uncharacterized protein n=1 Tax=Fimbriiglobus ruber TaxID=1908690 RepID=A0A225E4V6_9BACT|nr:hypothetical protein FRUB_00493 [Fimbriiglobus ruber]